MDTKLETELTYQLMPVRLDDDLLRYAMECSGMNNPEGARAIKAAYHFLLEAARTSERHKEAWVRQTTTEAMADCMDMVRQELVEAGVVDERVPPMFLSEALLTKLRQMRAAFHVNMVRAYPAKTYAEIAAEIDRTCWGTAITANDEILALHRQLAAEKLRADRAEARATAKSRECIELRERMAARPPIPRTPEQAIAFIGNQCEVIEEAEQPDGWRFQLTAHDLLSAFSWWFEAEPAPSDGAIYEAVSRRADPEGHAHAEAQLQEVLAYNASVAKKPELYTCLGKGGTYEVLGYAYGAGTQRGVKVMVYQDVPTGRLFWRDIEDFNKRMVRIGERA